MISLERDQVISRTQLLHSLVQSLYSRTEAEFNNGNFRIKGDTVDVFPSYADHAFRIHFLVMKLKRLKLLMLAPMRLLKSTTD